MKKKKHISACKIMLTPLILTIPAWSVQPVTILNHSFESPIVTFNGSTGAAPTSWAIFNSASLFTLNPADIDLTAEAPDGSNVALVESSTTETGLQQTLTTNLVADSSYSLTVKVSNPKIKASFPGYRIQLVVNETVIAEDNNTLTIAEDATVTSTVNYVYDPTSHAALVGMPLQIRLISKGLVESEDVTFDDVNLSFTLTNPSANAGGPYTIASTAALSLNGAASLPSEGQTISTYEWDLDNDGDYDENISGVTPTAIPYATLKSTYGMIVGTNTIKLRVTDDSLPTPKTSVTQGIVTLSPPIGCQLGVLNLNANGGINPNTGQAWKLGDQYRLAFHTNGTTPATSNDPEYYNQFVTDQAWQVAALKGSYWRAMVTVNLSNLTTEALSPKRSVRVNTGTVDSTGGAAIGGAGQPVFAMNGRTAIARNNADIWDGWSNATVSGNTVIRLASGSSNLNSSGVAVTASQNVHFSPFLNQLGLGDTATVHGVDVWAGTNFNGGSANVLGLTTDNTNGEYGSSNANTAGRVWQRFSSALTTSLRVYSISVPLTIVNLEDTVLPTLDSIVDNRSGSDFVLGADSNIVYTITFNEAIDAESVTIDDFELTGTAAGSITTIRGTLSANAVDVIVTPSAVGTLQLQIKTGAIIEDALGNDLNTASALADDTIIHVVSDTTPPTLSSITDNTTDSTITAFLPVTYSVTFSEAISSSSLTIADFANGGSAPVTVNSVTSTINPTIFTVVVTPTGAGTLNLQIPMGAVITDLVGNELNTVSALADDTTITVNPDPLPTLVSITDNQAGGPIFAGSSFAYTVTFSQPMLSSSLDAADFVNSGSPAITVNAVARTSNPRIYVVHVTPSGTGTIALQIAAGALITNVNGTAIDTTTALSDDTTIIVNPGSGPARGTITVNATVSVTSTTGTIATTLNASNSSKLVVIVTGENNNPGNHTGASNTVTYDGVSLTKLLTRSPIAGATADQIYNDIWYLDNPSAAHVAGAISANVNARGSITAFALSGTAPGAGQIAISPQSSKSTILSTTFANSIVIASHGMGGDGNTANVASVTLVSPLEGRTAAAQSSAWDGHVCAYAFVPVSGTATYSFSGGNLVGSHTIAAEFYAAEQSTPTYASWINGFFPGATDPLIIGALADPDRDGISNGIELILGGNPATVMDAALMPTLDLVKDPAGVPAGEYFLFTYRRSDLSVAAGVNSECEVDTDLVGSWTPASTVVGAVIQVDDNFSFSPPAADTDRVRVYVPRGANTRYFGRLKAVIP